jgi:hypothetical protein
MVPDVYNDTDSYEEEPYITEPDGYDESRIPITEANSGGSTTTASKIKGELKTPKKIGRNTKNGIG